MSGLNMRNSQNPFIVDSLIMQVDYESGTNAIYIGRAAPGTATSSNAWQIRKLTWDGNNNVTSMLFANGNSDFINKWDVRNTDYDYS